VAGDGEIHCGICRRSLLTGERPLIYLEPRSGGMVDVCPLCEERAERNGWQRQDVEPAPVPATGDDPARTVRLLEAQVNTLQNRLETTAETLADTRDSTSAQETELAALAARLADAEAEGAAARAALADAERRLAQSRHELDEARAAQQAIMRARRREADPVYLAGIAAEVFNRAPQCATIGLLTGLHGAPAVAIDVVGMGLPRGVRIRFAWPQGGREYRVDIDLVARRFDLVDLVPGGDGRLVPLDGAFAANADWVEGRVVTAPAEPTIL
jgi:hypothetical protein